MIFLTYWQEVRQAQGSTSALHLFELAHYNIGDVLIILLWLAAHVRECFALFSFLLPSLIISGLFVVLLIIPWAILQ